MSWKAAYVLRDGEWGPADRPDPAQLELELDDVRQVRVKVPWDGRSPRVLTKAFEKFSLGAHPGRGLRG